MSGGAAIDAATGAWTFTPSDANWFGSDSFTVTVTDDLGGTTTQVINITLVNVNDTPTGLPVVTDDDGRPGADRRYQWHRRCRWPGRLQLPVAALDGRRRELEQRGPDAATYTAG